MHKLRAIMAMLSWSACDKEYTDIEYGTIKATYDKGKTYFDISGLTDEAKELIRNMK